MDLSTALTLLPFIAACFLVALSGPCSGQAIGMTAWPSQVGGHPIGCSDRPWTVLYICIAVSGWLVWREVGLTSAMIVYAVQLVLNAGWSACSFGLRRLDVAFGELILLWLSIAANLAVFATISTAAALLLAPYLAWVTFAGVLNYTLWQMNRAPA